MYKKMGIATEPQFHVLAVDDSLLDRKLIERLLKSSSYQVTTVDSGCKALEFLGCQEVPLDSQQEVLVEVNLIITDYCMPGMTGYDLLKKVKESSSLQNIPVVIMSSENVPSRITRCLEEGAEDFFLKPVRLADVNKLRPHMLRTKCGQQQQVLIDTVLEDSQKPDRKHDDEPDQQQPKEQVLEPLTEEQQQMQQEQPPQPPVHQQPNNTKRKSMDDGLTPAPDRTRPRYNDLTTVI